MKNLKLVVCLSVPVAISALVLGWETSAEAQAIAPAADGTGTTVTQTENRFDINGGQLSGDEANLFHSFDRFNLNAGEIANFQSTPTLENILGRITGGDPSRINGSIQISGGNSNLFLMNPAGILFGANAQLNVPGDFFATTATGIGFGNGNWFNAIGDNHWRALVGVPSEFAFSGMQPGAIGNLGHLIVQPGQNLTLLGGTVLNAGTLSAPGGNITITAVPGESLVKISQTGHLLNLEVNRDGLGGATGGEAILGNGSDRRSAESAIAPLSLPELLTGGDTSHASQVQVNHDGTISIGGSGIRLQPQTGDAIASGKIDVSIQKDTPSGNTEFGGTVGVFGNRIAIADATIDASGMQGGGTVLIGGDFQGNGTVPNAQQTFVDSNAIVSADALTEGNGGKIIVWADNSTRFYGTVTARGGDRPSANSQNGGFVEISGGEFLDFQGNVDTRAPNGTPGMLLLDPTNLEIISEEGNGTTLDEVDAFSDPSNERITTISSKYINNATSNVTLQATEDITFNAPISIQAEGIGLIAEAGDGIAVNHSIFTKGGEIWLRANGAGGGSLLVDPRVPIASEGGNITLISNGSQVFNSRLETGPLSSAGGDVTLYSRGDIQVVSIDARGDSESTGGNVEVTAGGLFRVTQKFSQTDTSISTAGGNGGGTISIRHGGNGDTPFVIGDGRNNGTAGAISNGTDTLTTGSFRGNVTQGNIAIATAYTPPPEEPTPQQSRPQRTQQQPAQQQPTQQQPTQQQPAQQQPAQQQPAQQQPTQQQPTQQQPGQQQPAQQQPAQQQPTQQQPAQPQPGQQQPAQQQPGEQQPAQQQPAQQQPGQQQPAQQQPAQQQPTQQQPAQQQPGQQQPAQQQPGEQQPAQQQPGEQQPGQQQPAQQQPGEQQPAQQQPAQQQPGEQQPGQQQPAQQQPGEQQPAQQQPAQQQPGEQQPGQQQPAQQQPGEQQPAQQQPGQQQPGQQQPAQQQPGQQQPGQQQPGQQQPGQQQPAQQQPAQQQPGQQQPGQQQPGQQQPGQQQPGQQQPGQQQPGQQQPGQQQPGQQQPGQQQPGQQQPGQQQPGQQQPGQQQPAQQQPAQQQPAQQQPAQQQPAQQQPAQQTEAPEPPQVRTEAASTPTQNQAQPTTQVLNVEATQPIAVEGGGAPAIAIEPNGGNPSNSGAIAVQSNPSSEPAPNNSGAIAVQPNPSNEPAPNNGAASPAPSNPSSEPAPTENSGNPNTPETNPPPKGDAPTAPMPVNVANVTQSLDAGNLSTAVVQLDRVQDRQFADYFGQDLAENFESSENIRDTLVTITQQTNIRPGIVYTLSLPDQLELIVVTAEGTPIRKTVPEANREALLNTVAQFRGQLTNPRWRSSQQYLQNAQQLYQWLIAPIEEELGAQNINTLLFSMDSGLRSIPIAALYDGEKFIIEKYAVALIPSVSLTDMRYVPLKNARVLAMGASQFTELNPLPAVPLELSTIANQLWQGQMLLNEGFTRENLLAKRQEYPYEIIHLATHAEFKAGSQNNSFIQLWDEQLQLDRLRTLGWNDPQVQLLVLSACRTALGDERAELGFAGLAIAAGVKSALASLWYVSDEGTLALMTEFYQQLTEIPIKAEALRQAQLAMLRGEVKITEGELRGTGQLRGVELPSSLAQRGEQNLSHPYYWAGFTLIGSPW